MTRLFLVAALAVTGSALSARAGDAPIVPVSGGYPMAMPSSGYSAPVGETTVAENPHEVVGRRYGLLPFLRKGVFWKSNYGACASCEGDGLLARLGHRGAGGGGNAGPDFPGQGVPGIAQPGQPGGGMPGTLVFPYNPFIRSPRDYFMYEPK